MSLSIPSGFRFLTVDLFEIHDKIDALKPNIRKWQRDFQGRFMAASCEDVIDKAALKGEPLIVNPLSDAYKDWRKRQESVRSGYRDSTVDQEFAITIVPFNGRFYGNLLTEQDSWAKFFFNQDWVEKWTYFEHSENEFVHDDEWEARRRVWKSIFRTERSFSQVGYTITIEPTFGHLSFDEVLTYISPIHQRAKKQAKNAAINYYGAKLDEMDPTSRSEDVFAHASKAMLWTNTDEGEAFIETKAAEFEAILPVITTDLLLGSNK